MSMGTPEAEIEIREDLVRSLLQDQHPDLADQPLEFVEAGWDNVIFRLGDNLVVRMPRREAAAELVLNEQRCLPALAKTLPLPVPAPVRVGVPSSNYPWHWSVLPWLIGKTANEDTPRSDQAIPFASFLRALHQPAPADAPINPYRGGPLADRDTVVRERLVRLREKTDLIGRKVEAAWEAGLAASPAKEKMWLHGDLHARNILVVDGKLTGIIDWGDITSGDVATDLAAIWGIFEKARDRRHALNIYAEKTAPKSTGREARDAPNPIPKESDRIEIRLDASTLCRARGWAVSFGSILLDTGLVDHPRHAVMGEQILRRIEEDDF